MYYMNNTMLINYCELFIYVDNGYLSLFLMWTSFMSLIYIEIGINFLCTLHTNDYFKYLLGNPSYMGEEMFVMWRLGKCELAFGHDLNVVHVYNEMHARYIVWVESGIGGLKWKWKRLMKHFNLQSPSTSFVQSCGYLD